MMRLTLRDEPRRTNDFMKPESEANKSGRPTDVGSGAVVIPQPGETWGHRYHGPVKIIRKWNDRESICETPDRRRLLLMNELMHKTTDAPKGAAEV